MKLIIVIIIVSFKSFACFSQMAFVERIVKDNKARLAVVIKKGESYKRYFASCFFKEVTFLSDTTKIRLIGELLNYTSDTMKCYNPVYNLSGHYETIKREPTNKEYNLQIDALILINYIAFSSNAFIYSPYPLLFDKEANKEICCNSNDLNIVIALYKEWFRELKKNGLKGYCYPLYDKKYEWFGSKTKQQKFNEYPAWLSFYDCREVN